MGLFDKFKQTFNVGGVDVKIQAPATASQKDPIPVTVVLTTKSAQRIKGVRVQIERTSTNQTGPNAATANETTVIAQVEDTQVFELAPGDESATAYHLARRRDYAPGGAASR